MSKLKALYHKLPQPENWKVWVLIAFVVKSLFVVYFISLAYSLPADAFGFNWKGSIAKAGGDAPGHIESVENLLMHGQYDDDLRMPGLAWLYFVLRLVFSTSISLNILIFLQVVFSAVSVYLLSCISCKIFKSKMVFLLTYIIYLFSVYVSIYDYVIMPESLCASTLIFSIWCFFKYHQTFKLKYLLLSGVFITWAIFLRFIVFPVLILFVLFIILNGINNLKSKKVLKHVIIILFPFLLFDGFWVYRNYKIYERFIPFQKDRHYHYVMTGYRIHAVDFIRSYGGGNDEYWIINNAAIYFFPEGGLFFSEEAQDTLLRLIPKYVYTSKFNKDSLISLREKIIRLDENYLDSIDSKLLEREISEKFIVYTESIKNEKTFVYYFLSRIVSSVNLFKDIDYLLIYNWGAKNYLIELLLKKYYALSFYFVSIIGLLALIILFVKSSILFFRDVKKLKILLVFLLLITSYLIFIYPFVLKFSHNRYLVTAYPFLVILTAYFLSESVNFSISFFNKTTVVRKKPCQ